MKKLPCIRCTATAPASSIVATSRPSRRMPNYYVDDLAVWTPRVDIERMLIFYSQSHDARVKWFFEIYSNLRAESLSVAPTEYQQEEAWAIAALNLRDEILEWVRQMDEGWDVIKARAERAAQTPIAPTADPFAALRTERAPRTPQPKEAVPVC